MALTLFTQITDTVDEGQRAVWRHVSVTSVDRLGTRSAGGEYPAATFARGYETAVYDPDLQVAGLFKVPEEREMKEAKQYKDVLNRASKLMYEADRINIADPFEVFNLAFSATTSQPSRFFVKGNNGKDGNNTALGERLVSTQHAIISGAATVSNAVNSGGLSLAFSVDSYWTAKEQGATIVDDQNKPFPMFGGKVCLVLPPANGLVRTAKEINESDWKPGISDNNVNVLKGDAQDVISSPYLLKSFYVSGVANTKAWFLVDNTNRDPQVGTGLVKIAFVPLQTRVAREEQTDSIVYKLKQEYTYGFVDWRNVIASNGLGTAYSS